MVFIGGGTGSLCRFALARLMPYQGGFPWATLAANLVSCIVLGSLIGWFLKSENHSQLYVFFWTAGFCGGFSTFSTFSAETFQLLQQGDWATALINIVASLVICLMALFTGMKLVGL